MDTKNLAIMTAEGEINKLSSAVAIVRSSEDTILLGWRDEKGRPQKASLPKQKSEPLMLPLHSGSLFGQPLPPKPVTPMPAADHKTAIATSRTRSDEELIQAFKELVAGGQTVTLSTGQPPSRQTMKAAVSVRKRYKKKMRTLLLRSALKAEFNPRERKRLLTILPQGVIRAGRASDTKTREVVIDGKTYSCYRIDRQALRLI